MQPNAVLAGVPLLPTVSTGGAKFIAQRSFTAILPRFNALFRVSDAINLCGTISKGRRSPVVQLSAAPVAGVAVPNLQVVPDEVVWNYEGGIKGQGGAFRGSLGVFYQEYNGLQVTVTSAAGVTTTQSAGKARNPGVEAEGSLRLGRHVSLVGDYAYVDGKIANDATYRVYSGAPFRLQPQHSASRGATIRVPVEAMTFYATPSARYQSKVFFELPNNPAISQGGYALVNARAGIESAGGRYRVGGYVRDALDRRYLIDAGNTGDRFGIPTYVAGNRASTASRSAASSEVAHGTARIAAPVLLHCTVSGRGSRVPFPLEVTRPQ